MMVNYADDPKRAIRRLTVKTLPMCSIPLRIFNCLEKIDGNNAQISITKFFDQELNGEIT
jgi:hypothetical protein